jgi:hypothetical protein
MQLRKIPDDNKHDDDMMIIILIMTQLRSALFCICYAVCSCKSLPTFRHNCRYHLLFYFLKPEDGTKRLYRNVGNDLRATSCVNTQKSADLIYIAAKA